MNPLETAMWRAESADPRLRVNVSLLELLDPAPDWDRLLAAHEWASRMVPRMRQRVVEPALGRRRPALGDRGGPGPRPARPARPPRARPARCASCSTSSASSPPRRSTADRPLWEVLFVEGLADGRAGYVVKTHHSVTDGLGAVQLMSGCTAGPPSTTRPARAAGPAGRRRRSRVGVLAGQIADAVRSAPLAVLRRGAGAVGALGAGRGRRRDARR